MIYLVTLISSLIAATSVSIVEPVNGEIYDGDWLPFRVIIENENEVPDSVHYALNGNPVIQIPRLNTDWPTYMQNYFNHGYSEAPAPHDNTILWTAPITGTENEFPTPVVYEGIVFYPQDSGGEDLYALDAATGEILWIYEGTGFTDDAVTVSDGRLYTASDSIFCINAYTGDRIWASSEGNWWGSTPIVHDGKVFCGNSDNLVVCLDASDGSLIWISDSLASTVSCMAMSEGMLFVPTNSTDPGLCALDASNGSLLWTNTDLDGGYWDSSPVLVGSDIYLNGCFGNTISINMVTGETIWMQPTNGGTATIAYHEGGLYFAPESPYGSYCCLEASTGSTLWVFPGNQHGSSGIADGLVFYGDGIAENDSASVRALDTETGLEVWSYRTSCTGTGLKSSPSITDGVMYYACLDGYLYAFGTGLKYTYKEDYFYADVGSNELIVTSWDDGAAVAADTISFTVAQTGITLEPTHLFNLCASPNPMRTSASVSFNLTEPGAVILKVFDLAGREITTLADQQIAAGEHSIYWNGVDLLGKAVSSGLYFCRIEHCGLHETTGLCVLR